MGLCVCCEFYELLEIDTKEFIDVCNLEVCTELKDTNGCLYFIKSDNMALTEEELEELYPAYESFDFIWTKDSYKIRTENKRKPIKVESVGWWSSDGINGF